MCIQCLTGHKMCTNESNKTKRKEKKICLSSREKYFGFNFLTSTRTHLNCFSFLMLYLTQQKSILRRKVSKTYHIQANDICATIYFLSPSLSPSREKCFPLHFNHSTKYHKIEKVSRLSRAAENGLFKMLHFVCNRNQC